MKKSLMYFSFHKEGILGLSFPWPKRAGRFKMELHRTGIDKEDPVEWLRRGLINWDGERVIINAHHHKLMPLRKWWEVWTS